MGSLLFTISSFVVALAILIAVHEFGHFWVARKLGVKVLRFSIGFGRPLWRHQARDGETEYVIAAIPLGGYVKMLDEREAPVDAADRERAFNRQSLPVRSAIVVAGPLFNFIFAIFAFWLIFVMGDIGLKPLVGEVEPDSRAEQAGFLPGDEILEVGEQKTPSWENVVYSLLAQSLDQTSLPIRVLSESGLERQRMLDTRDLQTLAEEGKVLENLGLKPDRPTFPPVIGEVLSGEPAERAGLLTGDRILSVDGTTVESWPQWVEYVQARPEQTLQLEIERAGEILTLPITTAVMGEGEKAYGRIGAGVDAPDELMEGYRSLVRYGPVDAVGHAFTKTWDMSLLMLRMLGKMVIGEVSVKNLSGPISIADTAGKSASFGLVYFIKFLAVVSVSLGVLNLLPIPVLDGGHLFFFLIEAVKGGPLPERFVEQGQKIGMMILLVIMSIAFYVDLNRYLG
jgi:regulator of sigma E protease